MFSKYSGQWSVAPGGWLHNGFYIHHIHIHFHYLCRRHDYPVNHYLIIIISHYPKPLSAQSSSGLGAPTAFPAAVAVAGDQNIIITILIIMIMIITILIIMIMIIIILIMIIAR